MKNKKKIAVLMAVVVVCTAVMGTFAPTGAGAAPRDVPAREIVAGTTIYFGKYQQGVIGKCGETAADAWADGKTEGLDFVKSQNYSDGGDWYYYSKNPIAWTVLEKADGELLLISRGYLAQIQYGIVNDPIKWRTSYVRALLNKNFFFDAFNAGERAAINTSQVETPENSVYGNPSTVDVTEDKVFLPSIEEVLQFMPADSDRNTADVTNYILEPVFINIDKKCFPW